MSALLLVGGICLIVGILIGVLLMATLAASHPEDTGERLLVQPPDVSAALQQELPGLANQRPPATHRPPPSGSSSQAEGC